MGVLFDWLVGLVFLGLVFVYLGFFPSPLQGDLLALFCTGAVRQERTPKDILSNRSLSILQFSYIL